MAVELNLGGKNYQYTPRHPYREVVISNGENAFKIESPDGTALCTIKGDTAHEVEKKIKRAEDLTREEITRLLQFGFFSPNGVQPAYIPADELSQSSPTSESIFKKITMLFRRERSEPLY